MQSVTNMPSYEETMKTIAARDAALTASTGLTASHRAAAKIKARRAKRETYQTGYVRMLDGSPISAETEQAVLASHDAAIEKAMRQS